MTQRGVPGAALRVFGAATARHGLPLLILTAAYAVVAFPILVQGTTLPRLLRRLLGPATSQG